MKKPLFFAIGALFLAFFAFGNGANAAKVNTKEPSITVPTVTTSDNEISGTATKNVNVYVKLNNSKKVASTTSDSKGNYTIKLPKKYAVNTKLYVYAQASNAYNYFYRIVTVKDGSTDTSSSTTSSSSSTTSSSTSSSSVNTAKVNELMGSWKSSASGKYTQLWVFNNETGLNQTLYKSKTYDSKLLNNAVFNVKNVNGNVITLTYRGKGIKKTSTMYIRLVSKNKFYLVTSDNKLAKVKFGSAPAATYTFTKIK